MKEYAGFIIIALAAMWTLQYGLSFLQLRRFYKRIHQLRRYGSVWIGKYGSAWKGREFAVVCVNKARIITHVEKFSGWTVMAKLEPVQGMDGIAISQILDDSVELPVSAKFKSAILNAVQLIQEADEKAAAKAAEKAKESEIIDVTQSPETLENSSI